MDKRVKDLTGKVFRYWKVIEFSGTINRRAYWLCKCLCGKEMAVMSQHLINGRSSSCGCVGSIRNLTGKVFSRLLVLGLNKIEKGKAHWYCLCDCGKLTTICGTDLTKKTRVHKSCGCYRIERSTTHGMSKTKQYSCYATSIRRSRKKRATPKWSDLEAIRKIYAECPEGFTVDHIIPLCGKDRVTKVQVVSGLHVPENLQYLTHSENSSKWAYFDK